jgi:uncharacterized protein YdhG (YjbR/CyaY superfamily)
MASKFETVDEYIASFPEDVQVLLRQVRKAIQKVLPKAEEKIKYGMPAVMISGRHAVYFAAWKRHIGLYPVYRSDAPIEAELAPYRDAKDTLQFPLNQPIPSELIERVVVHLSKMA